MTEVTEQVIKSKKVLTPKEKAAKEASLRFQLKILVCIVAIIAVAGILYTLIQANYYASLTPQERIQMRADQAAKDAAEKLQKEQADTKSAIESAAYNQRFAADAAEWGIATGKMLQYPVFSMAIFMFAIVIVAKMLWSTHWSYA
jgi:Tfp pilus assembly protein PilX